MLVEFPIFGAGINYFPTEISALRVFEPRYLLLIADSILNKQNFIVSSSLGDEYQIGSLVIGLSVSPILFVILIYTTRHFIRNLNS